MSTNQFVNLTPHKITMRTAGWDIEIPASGQIARVTEKISNAGMLNGIPVVNCKLGQVTNLPEPTKDTIYIVSPMVLGAIKNRFDVVAPDTGPESAIRDADGNIIAVKRFRQMA